MCSSSVTKLDYLARIGYDERASAELAARSPNRDDLVDLIQKHILSVPFENLGQHTHRQCESAPAVPRIDPSLDVQVSLAKIVRARRGGFCWEINFCFAWLLRQLGYKVRLATSNVITPSGPVAGHLCLLVDGIHPDCAVLVDPGFGDPPRVPIPLTTKQDESMVVSDEMLGDSYKLVPTAQYGSRFNTLLMRQRPAGMSSSTMSALADLPDATHTLATPFEAVHVFNCLDDNEMGCQEFKDGLAHVLRDSPDSIFSQKRFCLLCTPRGFKFLGEGYMKEKVLGEEVRRVVLTDEVDWRKAADAEFGITLNASWT